VQVGFGDAWTFRGVPNTQEHSSGGNMVSVRSLGRS